MRLINFSAVLLCGLALVSGAGCAARSGSSSPDAAISQAVLSAADNDFERVLMVSPNHETGQETFDFLREELEQPQGTYVSYEDVFKIGPNTYRVVVQLDDTSDAELLAEVERNADGGWVRHSDVRAVAMA